MVNLVFLDVLNLWRSGVAPRVLPRCRYYRTQCVCPETTLEDYMEHRARGTCHLDQLPDRDLVHMRQ